MGYGPQDRKEMDMSEVTEHTRRHTPALLCTNSLALDMSISFSVSQLQNGENDMCAQKGNEINCTFMTCKMLDKYCCHHCEWC